MSAIGELSVQCRKRRWRLLIDGSYPDGRHEEGFIANSLEVRDQDRELLAHVSFDPVNPDEAAVGAARALQQQGLIA